MQISPSNLYPTLLDLTKNCKKIPTPDGCVVYNLPTHDKAQQLSSVLSKIGIRGSSGNQKFVAQHLPGDTDYGVILTRENLLKLESIQHKVASITNHLAQSVLYKTDDGCSVPLFNTHNDAEKLSYLLMDIDIVSQSTHGPKHVGQHVKNQTGYGVVLNPNEIEILNRLATLTPPDLSNTTNNKLKVLPDSLKNVYSHINSSQLQNSNGKTQRDDFFNDHNYKTEPPIISTSDFVPKALTEHLMRHKKDSALGVKYTPGDSITNMEGAMHTFVTPVCKINMTGDYKYAGSHTAAFLNGKQRPVIMTASIHPDFESSGKDEVVMRLIEVKQNPVKGAQLPENFKILSQKYSPSSQEFSNALPAYDEQLRAHMIYHLTHSHELPGLNQVQGNIMMVNTALSELESIIMNKNIQDISSALAGKFVNLNNHIISLEALYNIYLNQIRNEFSVLEGTLPQGYVYTIDPPSIFAAQIGSSNIQILNQLQLLAIKEINANSGLKNLKILGFNDYADPKTLTLYRAILPNAMVLSKRDLFKGPNGEYSNSGNYALVEHNNSDGFGQNIETEGVSSKDGVLGVYSDASHALNRMRSDLLSRVI